MSIYKRGEDGYPIGSDDVMRKGWGKIPDATLFQDGIVYAVPSEVHGWQWSETFGCWSAFVTFKSGWTGWTFPKR